MLRCVIINNVHAIINNYTLYVVCTHTLATYLPIYFNYITYVIHIHDSKDHYILNTISGVSSLGLPGDAIATPDIKVSSLYLNQGRQIMPTK